jgi:hypothetical protein
MARSNVESLRSPARGAAKRQVLTGGQRDRGECRSCGQPGEQVGANGFHDRWGFLLGRRAGEDADPIGRVQPVLRESRADISLAPNFSCFPLRAWTQQLEELQPIVLHSTGFAKPLVNQDQHVVLSETQRFSREAAKLAKK